jgi:hypothetical protein
MFEWVHHWILCRSRGACHGKGNKATFQWEYGLSTGRRLPETTRAERRIFCVDAEWAGHPLGVLLRTFDQGRSLCPSAAVTGDSEKPAAGRQATLGVNKGRGCLRGATERCAHRADA